MDVNDSIVGVSKAVKKQGLKNPTRVIGNAQKNGKSADALQERILAGNNRGVLQAKKDEFKRINL